jgi:hypothetical protein
MCPLFNRRSIILGAATSPLLARPGRVVAEVSSGGLPPAQLGEITLTDLRGASKQEYSSGHFLAFQAVNDASADRLQTITLLPESFPKGTILRWKWPDNANDSVKSWNAIDYGNYLNTITPAQVPPSRIKAISALIHEADIGYSAPSDSANVALDLFLYTSGSSTEATMACEIQVFLHATPSARRFMATLESLGLYESAAIGSSPSVRWAVTRQQSNFFKTPYYLFCPSDGSDQLASTFDVKALLNWLRSVNQTTGKIYLTGEEYFNGLATGVEPVRKSGSALFHSIEVTYTR